jgi:hypothetical protein
MLIKEEIVPVTPPEDTKAESFSVYNGANNHYYPRIWKNFIVWEDECHSWREEE